MYTTNIIKTDKGYVFRAQEKGRIVYESKTKYTKEDAQKESLKFMYSGGGTATTGGSGSGDGSGNGSRRKSRTYVVPNDSGNE